MLNKLIKAICMVLIFGDDLGADNYSIPPRIDFDPFSKLDTCNDAAMNKKTKLKLIINKKKQQ